MKGYLFFNRFYVTKTGKPFFCCIKIFIEEIYMTEKELKKLNRYQLLEIIIMQTEEIEKLTQELEHTKKLLENRKIDMACAGNIAKASLVLSGVFEAAQAAADVYLDSVKEYSDKAEEIITSAHTEAQRIIETARQQAVKTECAVFSDETE